MNERCKIIGIIQAHNEFPLLGLSISHALTYHADMIYVLNHAPETRLQENIGNIGRIWKDRLKILNYYDSNFFQESSTNVMIEICQEQDPDWIWVFDTDEFLITKDNQPLKNVLQSIDQKYSTVRYEVQNFISLENFDETQLENFKKLKFRTKSTLFCSMPPKILVDEIISGNINFFDDQFPRKIIMRNNKTLWLGPGAHNLKYTVSETFDVESQTLKVAHFPFLTFNRTKLRSNQGKKLIDAGFPIDHGWQSQMIFKLLSNSSLNQFWMRHSVSQVEQKNMIGNPTIVEDESFSISIGPVVDRINHWIEHSTLEEADSLETKYNKDDSVPLSTFINLVRKQQLISDTLHREYDTLKYKYDNTKIQMDIILNSRAYRLTVRFAHLLSKFPKINKILQKILNIFMQ